jgi:hypothetical protein
MGRTGHIATSSLLASLVALVAAPAAWAAEAKPAGGAAIGEVVGATAAATLLTAALFWFGMRHRSGKSDRLRGAAERSKEISGLPAWASLPVLIASLALLVAVFGMYWDIALHIDKGRDEGPLANPAHYFILVGLFGIFAAGFLSIVLPDEKPSRAAVRITKDWYAPVGGIVLMATSGFALLGFPLDDAWHRIFGQDVTLWGPTHLMMIGGAGIALLGQATLMNEGGRPEQPEGGVRQNLLAKLFRFRLAAVFGGLLIGLSTFQAEFDFGVPQFQLVFHPILIALAAGFALVGARIYSGPGGALIAFAFFWVVRGILSVLVGPVLGETTPHLPLYLVEALLVELVALRVATKERPYRFGAICGALIGTVGVAAEWGWSHVWMPYPWPASLLPEGALAGLAAGLAGGLIGAFVGTALSAPARRTPAPAPSLAPAVAAVGVVILLIGYGLVTSSQRGVTANVTLTEAAPAPKREVNASVRVDPPEAAEDAKWLSVTAWQGDGLVVNRLEEAGDGVYRTTEPIPVYPEWKTLLRLHTGNSLSSVPLYLPDDPAIPAKGVPAVSGAERPFVEEKQYLQREVKDDVPSYLLPLASSLVGGIALALVALLGWALARVAGAAAGRSPRPPRSERSRAGGTRLVGAR